MRWRLRGAAFAVAITLAAVTGVPVQPASATTFAPMTTAQFVDASTWIVEGTVVEVWTETDVNHHVWTRARVQISTLLKGTSDVDELIVDSLGGTFEGHRTTVPGAAKFTETEEVFLFLAEQGSGRIVPVSKFLGKFTVRRAPGATSRYAMNWHARTGDSYFDARFLPHPPAKERLDIEDLRNEVTSRLQVGWDGKPIPGISNERLAEINTPLVRRVQQ